MSKTDKILSVLKKALAFKDMRVILRGEGAIAEVQGPLKLRRGDEWLRLGEETGSHIHLKTESVHQLHYVQPKDGNAGLEVLDPRGEVLLRLLFRGTNPDRPETYDEKRLASVKKRFDYLMRGEER